MTVTNPKVRDFTGAERRLAVEVVSGEVFEVLLSLYVLGGDEDDTAFEMGAEWFEGIRSRAPEGLLERLSTIGDWSVWIALVGEAYDMGAPYTTERLLERLEGRDPVDLRAALAAVGAEHATGDRSAEDLAALAGGDADAVAAAEQWCEKCPGLVALLQMPPDESKRALLGALRSFWEDVAPVPEATAAILERDAEHKRSLARRMDPERLVEQATNGITVAPGSGVETVVLVPSVVLRPWVLITERNGARIFCYSVAEENLGGDPGAPPAWLVQFYKALGDERRLSILRRLAEGPASFAELVEHLDLAKSTVHHHVRQLRTAGLVRVTVGDEREYSLRSGSVPEAARLLEGFLGMAPEAE